MANFYSNISLKQNQIQDAVIHPTSAPGTPVEGQIYYDTGSDTMKFWGDPQGTTTLQWVDMGLGDTTYAGTTVSGIRVDGSDKIWIDIYNSTNTGSGVSTSDLIVFCNDSSNAGPEKCTIAEMLSGNIGVTSITPGTGLWDGTDSTAITSTGTISLDTSDSGSFITAVTDGTAATVDAANDFVLLYDADASSGSRTTYTTVAKLLASADTGGTVTTVTGTAPIVSDEATDTPVISLDIKANSGIEVDANELSMNLGASSITGTLGIADGGTGATSFGSNELLTGNSTTDIQSEPSLTYSSNQLKITSTSENDTPRVQLESSSEGLNYEPMLDFYRSFPVDADGHNFGQITFRGNQEAVDDGSGNLVSAGAITWARILVETAAGGYTENAEEGSLKIGVVSAGDGYVDGLTMYGTDTIGRVDLSLGAGATSRTTVKGDLKVTTLASGSTSDIAVMSNSNVLETRTLGSNAFDSGGYGTTNTGTVTSVTAGTGLDVDGSAGSITETGTLNVIAAQTGITSIFNTGLKIGYASDGTWINFGTDNQIEFAKDGVNVMTLLGTALQPAGDDSVDLGTSSQGWKDLYIDGIIQPTENNVEDGAAHDLVIKGGSQQNGDNSVNDAGGKLKLYGGAGTGTGAGGNIEFYVADGDGDAFPGIVQNNWATALTISDDKKAAFAGEVTIAGNLTVSGAVTTKLSETVNIEDNMILLNSNETSGATEDAGIEVERGTDTNVSFYWDETGDVWKWTEANSAAGAVDFTGTLYDLTQSGLGVTINSSYYTNTQYTAGTGITLNTLQFDVNVPSTTQSVGAESLSTTANRTYQVQAAASGDNLVVNVPWDAGDTDTQLDQTSALILRADTDFENGTDGVHTAAITHGLGSHNLVVTLWESSAANGTITYPLNQIFARVKFSDASTLKVEFDNLPTGDVLVTMVEAVTNLSGGIAYS